LILIIYAFSTLIISFFHKANKSGEQNRKNSFINNVHVWTHSFN